MPNSHGRETKTIRLGGDRKMEVPVVSFADGLTDNSMDESDDQKKQPRKRRKIVNGKKPSGGRDRKSVLKRVKPGLNRDRKRQRHVETRSPSGMRRVPYKILQLSELFLEIPIRAMLGVDFDMPAFHHHSVNGSLAVDGNGDPSGSEEDVDVDESSDHSISRSPPRRQLQALGKSKSRGPTSSGSPSRSTSKVEATRTSDVELIETESEPELPSTRHAHGATSAVGCLSLSDTESEEEVQAAHDTDSEEEVDVLAVSMSNPKKTILESRPAFPPTAEQEQKRALVLDGPSRIQVPRSLSMFLRPYQEDGVQFFWRRFKEGRGGILGDDMGLGKTIQVIAFLSAIMRKSGNQLDEHRRKEYVDNFLDNHDRDELPEANARWPTSLVVAPKTVVGNWEREFLTWSYLEIGVFDGPAEHRASVLRSFKMGRFDVLLASHETVRDHIEDLELLELSCIFVDEAHKLKNPKSKTCIAYNRFECKSRFGLTGTALQNSYRELWPLFDWANPGGLGSQTDWETYIVKPMTEGQSKQATDAELVKFRELSKRFVERLLPAFFLRRTKDIIKDQLPQKIDQVIFCPLTPLQIVVYQRFLATEDVQLMKRKDEPCGCGSPGKGRGYCCHTQNANGIHWRYLLLKYISILLKVSNSLLLLFPSPYDSDKQKAENRERLKVAFGDTNSGTYATALLQTGLCGKWDVLFRLLQTWKTARAEKNKVLIFSKSVKLLNFLAMRLKIHQFSYHQLDGKVKHQDRFVMIDDFNSPSSDIFIFLISTLTGGTGLNLVAANKVVIFDPNWNPAHDLQAMDRAFRFGQQRDVSVYRLLGAGSLEELVYARQVYKQQQMKIAYKGSHQTRYFSGVQNNKDKQGELFGIKNILTLHTSLVTQETMELAHVNNLEWALANSDGAGSGDNAEELGDMNQLVQLLVEDEDDTNSVPARYRVKPAKKFSQSQDDGIIADAGIQYTHVNDDVLQENNVEARIAAQAVTKPKGGRRSSASVTQSITPWPPRREHHKVYDAATQRLERRKAALLAKGYDVASYAAEFAALSKEEQESRLRELDKVPLPS